MEIQHVYTLDERHEYLFGGVGYPKPDREYDGSMDTNPMIVLLAASPEFTKFFPFYVHVEDGERLKFYNKYCDKVFFKIKHDQNRSLFIFQRYLGPPPCSKKEQREYLSQTRYFDEYRSFWPGVCK